MTIGAGDLLFYAGAILILFLTPGPVWVALMARAMAGGFAAAWPLAAGVVLGDALWPLLAIFGMAWLIASVEGALEVMRWVAAGIFVVMGVQLIRHAGHSLAADSRLMRPGRGAGFAAGVAVIVGNPKAILFYMGVLPGFFDLGRVTAPDIAAIVLVSTLIPLAGNLAIAMSIDRARRLVASGDGLKRMNRWAGALLIGVGLVIPLT